MLWVETCLQHVMLVMHVKKNKIISMVIKKMKGRVMEKKNNMVSPPPCCRELKKEKKKSSFLNILGRIEERKEGEKGLRKIGYGGG